MGVDAHFVTVVTVGNGCIQTNLSVIFVIHGTNFKAVLVAPQESGLLSTIAGGPTPHDARLDKDATATVGIGTFRRINCGKSNTILIVLSEMKVSTEPSLDAAMFPDEFDELAALDFVTVIEPAATVNDVIFL